jgi:XisI protein
MERLNLKIKKHQSDLTEYVEKLAKERNESIGSSGGYQAITDTIHNQFQLVRMGWHDGQFYFRVLLHFSIHPETGNIWVQHNTTEIDLEKDFAAYNITKKQIVLGFRSTDLRVLSDYAVA